MRTIFLLFFFSTLFIHANCQSDSTFYKSCKICLDIREGILGRQIIKRQVFTLDTGKTWKFLGFCGGRLRPYISDNSEAIKWLDRYRTYRRIGYAQMLIICPLSFGLLINYGEHHNPNDESHDYLGMVGLVSLFTGIITNRIIAPNFLGKSLQGYNHDNYLGISDYEVDYNFSYNNVFKNATIKYDCAILKYRQSSIAKGYPIS
jgi:hypothetical protein